MLPAMNPHPSSRALGLAFTAAITLAAAARAQTPAPNLPPSSATISATASPQLSDAQLETLLGPVALYPDAIALILPAATAPSDVVLAARFLAVNRDELQLENQPWDESVRGLARYPDVIKWMDENLAWTKQVGEAFLAQPADAMQAVQRLRARARAAGTLVDTPEQKIVTEGGGHPHRTRPTATSSTSPATTPKLSTTAACQAGRSPTSPSASVLPSALG